LEDEGGHEDEEEEEHMGEEEDGAGGAADKPDTDSDKDTANIWTMVEGSFIGGLHASNTVCACSTVHCSLCTHVAFMYCNRQWSWSSFDDLCRRGRWLHSDEGGRAEAISLGEERRSVDHDQGPRAAG
jgi:hypothetical protein